MTRRCCYDGGAMRFDMARALWCSLASLSAAAFAAGCVGPGGARAPVVASVQPAGGPGSHGPRSSSVESAPTQTTGCPLPPRVDAGYNLGQLPVFSKTL